jgi:hypothetical protein
MKLPKDFTPASPRLMVIAGLSDAHEYVAAAKVLNESQHLRVSGPFYLLVSEAIELLLKSYIVAEGGSSDALRRPRIRHSLNGLLAMAETLGCNVCSAEARDLIAALHPLHESHYFRYRNINHAEWPSAYRAMEALRQFETAISPLIANAINDKGRWP